MANPFMASRSSVTKETGTGSVDRAQLRKDIMRLRKIEERSFGPRHPRTAFYDYLEAVLKLYWKLKKKGITGPYREALIDEFDLPRRRGNSLLRLIIDASSKQHEKVRSRWAQALAFLARKRKRYEKGGWGKRGVPFKTLVLEHGGISGCASEMSQKRKKDERQNTGRSERP